MMATIAPTAVTNGTRLSVLLESACFITLSQQPEPSRAFYNVLYTQNSYVIRMVTWVICNGGVTQAVPAPQWGFTGWGVMSHLPNCLQGMQKAMRRDLITITNSSGHAPKPGEQRFYRIREVR